MDANHDGSVTPVEMIGAAPPPELYASVDVNRDGAIASNEWHWSRAAFDRHDLNHDARITREEFKGPRRSGHPAPKAWRTKPATIAARLRVAST